MKPTEKQITKNQLFCAVIILCLTSAVLAVPAVLAETAGRDLWLSALITIIAYLIMFGIFIWIYKLNPDKDVYTILKDTLGVAAAKAIFIVLAAMFAFKLLMLSCETEEFCSAKLYEQLSWNRYSLIFYGLFCYMAVKGLKVISRSGEITIVFILASIIFTIAAASGSLMPGRLLPIASEGAAPIFRGAYKTAVWSGDFLVLLLALGNVKPDKKIGRSLFIAYGASAALILIFMAAYYSLFGSLSGFQGHGQAMGNMTKFSADGSMGFISSVFNQFWIGASTMKAAWLFWGVNEAMLKVTGIKKPVWTAIPLAALIYITDIYIFRGAERIYYFAIQYMNYFTAAAYGAVPVIILACAAVYKKKNGGADNAAPVKPGIFGKNSGSGGSKKSGRLKAPKGAVDGKQ